MADAFPGSGEILVEEALGVYVALDRGLILETGLCQSGAGMSSGPRLEWLTEASGGAFLWRCSIRAWLQLDKSILGWTCLKADPGAGKFLALDTDAEGGVLGLACLCCS